MTTATPNVSRMEAKGSGRVTTRLTSTACRREAEHEGDQGHRYDEHQGVKSRDDGGEGHADECAQDDELAVRQVDHAHHADDEGEADPEQAVEAAVQDAVDDRFEPDHGDSARDAQVPK